MAGALDPGDKVVVTEDTVTRGTSLLEAVHAVRDAGAEVVLAVAVVDRGGAAEQSSGPRASPSGPCWARPTSASTTTSADAGTRTEERVVTRSGGRGRLGVIVVVSLVVRVAYVYGYRHHVQPTGDAVYFHYQADLLASGHGFIDPFSLLYQIPDHAGRQPSAAVDTGARLGGRRGGHVVLRAALVELCHRGPGSRRRRPGRARGGGPRVGLVAAAIAGLYPVFVIDDGSLLAETLVAPLVALVVWAFYRMWRQPSLPRAAVLGGLSALAALTRSELVLLVVFLGLFAGLFCRTVPARRRVVLSGVALVAAVLVFVPWWAYTLPRFDHPVLLSDQLGLTLATANCGQTYSGRLMGYWTDDCETARPTPSGADPTVRDRLLEHDAVEYAEHHASRVPAVVVARLGRTLGFFRPGQQVDLEWSVLGRPRLPAGIGLGVYYVLLVLAAPGAVVLRRQGLPLAPFVLIGVEVVMVAAAIFGQTRYRVPLDVVLVVLASVSLDRVLPGRAAHARGRDAGASGSAQGRARDVS